MRSQRLKLFLLSACIWSFPFEGLADSPFEIKKLIFSDCNKAIDAAATLSPESRASIVEFLKSVLENSTALQQPMLPSPNISSPFTDEPKIGEIIAINSVERDSKAKRCALNIAPIFFPEALSLVQSITSIASNKELPKDIRDLIAVSAAKWSAKIQDNNLKISTLKSAINVYIKDTSNAAAQNVIIELANSDLSPLFDSLVHLETQIDSQKLTGLLSVIDPTKRQTAEYVKKLSLETGLTRSLAIELLKTLPKELIVNDVEWAKKIAALAVDPTYSQLMEDYDLFNLSQTQEVLVGLLKGATPEDKDTIIILLSKYRSHIQSAEEQLLKRSLASDSVSNVQIRDALISSAVKHSNDVNIRKKWSPFVISVFNFFFNSSEQIPLHILNAFVSFYPELIETFKTKWPGKKTDNKKWLKLYLDWFSAVGGVNFAKATSIILSSLWKEPIPSWIEDVFASQLLNAISSTDWQVNKQLISPVKSILLGKSSTASQKNLGLKLLFKIDPKKLTKLESKELLTSTDCSLISAEDLYSASGISTDEYFGIFLGCYQRGLIDRSKIIQFFLTTKLNIDARKKLFISSIDNVLYDRGFRASLLAVAGALSIQLESQSKTIEELLKDSDPLVQFQTLDSISKHNSVQIQPILPLLKTFAETSANSPDNRALALMIYLNNSSEELSILVDILQSALSSQPVAKAILAQYQNIPSNLYVQALTNRLPDLEPAVKIKALESLLLATNPVLLDGVPIEVLNKLQDSKVESVKELANSCIILKSLVPTPELETLIKSSLYTNSRWRIIGTDLRSRIPEAVINKLKLDLCPEGKTACLVLDRVR